MDQLLAALDAGWKVLLAGVFLGAGLPAIFAYGVRALAWGTGGDAGLHEAGVVLKPHLWGRVVATATFSIVVIAVLLGIGYIVAHGFGMTITFNGLIPVFTQK